MTIPKNKKAVKTFSAILATLTAAFGLNPSAQALEQPNPSAVEKVWDYTRNLNSVEGYRAFISAHSDDATLTKEARSRAIGLLGDFDLGDTFLSSHNVSSSLYGGSDSYQLAAVGDFIPPYGARKWTLSEVLVDANGHLVNSAGEYVSPQGQIQHDGPCRVTADGTLLGPDGAVIATDVGIVPSRNDSTVVGKLSLRDKDMQEIAADRTVVSTTTGRIVATPSSTPQTAALAARTARAQAQTAGIASAASAGSYAG